jgi:putative endonuclease
MTHERLDLGKLGEEQAVARLKKEGYRVIARNYRNTFGEIDIIAQDGKTLCFVEVRTRTKDWHGHPFESISSVKQKKIIRAAQGYLTERDIDDIDARFDVVAVIPDEAGGFTVEFIKNAFEVG